MDQKNSQSGLSGLVNHLILNDLRLSINGIQFHYILDKVALYQCHHLIQPPVRNFHRYIHPCLVFLLYLACISPPFVIYMEYFTIYCHIKEVRTFVLLNITKLKITLTIITMPLFTISTYTKYTK